MVFALCKDLQLAMSLPVRGAWIEMVVNVEGRLPRQRSLPVRGAWIEILEAAEKKISQESLPVRGAWIEIQKKTLRMKIFCVAPRAGSVD